MYRHPERPPSAGQLHAAIGWALASFPDLALTSGFNLNGVVLIDLAVNAGYGGNVLFVDTGYHFPETLQTRDAVAARYPDLNVVTLNARRPDDRLYLESTDRCCTLRKVEPLRRYLDVQGVSALLSARSRDQSSSRAGLELLDARGNRTKVNPLVYQTRDWLESYAQAHALPVNPLYWQGMLSIGCAPCTRAPKPGEGARAGRWSGEKLECGLWTGGI